MAIHHSTIRKYTAALLDIFNELEVGYSDSNGIFRTKNIPVKFSTREKSTIFDEHETEQLLNKNYNILPRASLSFSTLSRSNERTTNKNVKLNTYKTDNSFEYMYNAVPYTFTFELTILCRGMNEATMVVEQVLPLFNPIYNIDIFEAPNLDEPTRIPVSLLDVSISPMEEYSEFSQNILEVNFGLELKGNIYPPIRSIERIKEFKMNISQYGNPDDNYFKRTSISGWDVNEDGNLENEITNKFDGLEKYVPEIIDIIGINITIGDNDLSVIYEDKDSILQELDFSWNVLSGDATITTDKDKAVLTVHSSGEVVVSITITDIHGNYNSLEKTYLV